MSHWKSAVNLHMRPPLYTLQHWRNDFSGIWSYGHHYVISKWLIIWVIISYLWIIRFTILGPYHMINCDYDVMITWWSFCYVIKASLCDGWMTYNMNHYMKYIDYMIHFPWLIAELQFYFTLVFGAPGPRAACFRLGYSITIVFILTSMVS